MIGLIPPEIAQQLRPMPDDFVVSYTQRPGVLAWRGNVIVETEGRRETIACEVGARFIDPFTLGVAMLDLRQTVWHLKEMARLGHTDYLKAARLDRHAGHPVSHPSPFAPIAEPPTTE